MDLTDLDLDLALPPPARPAAPAPAPVDPHALVAQIGSEVASALSAALERVNVFATTGRIDRTGLRALHDEIELARRTGIMGQQVSRLAAGRVQVARERLDLTQLLREALRQRAREIEARGLELRQAFAPAEVTSDATLLYSLVQTLLDWSFEHTISRIDLALEVAGWPARARLSCRFADRLPDQVTDRGPQDRDIPVRLETMSWRLLDQTARTLGLNVQRRDTPERTTLVVEFPDTVPQSLDTLPGVPRADLGDTTSQAFNSKPLAGRHVLVIAARREVRGLVREALRPMGMLVDFVTSVEEAASFCRGALPHAVVYEAALAGERFERLRREALAAVPSIAFVRIAEDGQGFETVNAGGHAYAQVGRDAIVAWLPAALSHELARLAASGG
jgi:CheY-like chemotaxis protein